MEKEVEDCRLEVVGIFQKLKGYVQQVDSLSEENSRLKKYLKEVREAYLKLQSDHAELKKRGPSADGENCSSKGGKDHDGKEESQGGDEVDGIQPENAMMNSLVLDNVLTRLSPSEVQSCRLVCHTWNEVALMVLSKLNNGTGPGLILSDDFANFKKKQANRIHNLCSVMSLAPKQMFRKAYLDDRSLGRPGFTKMLVDYGHNLMSITVTTGYLRWPTLKSILTQWCPNLEELDFHYLKIREERMYDPPNDILPYQKDLQLLRVLKLKTLAMDLNWNWTGMPDFIRLPEEDSDNSDAEIMENPRLLPREVDMVNILGSIIGACPGLKTLTLKGSSSGGTASLLRKIREYPEVTKQLETIFMCGTSQGNMDAITELNNLELSSKLKSLTISSGLEETKIPKEELGKILGKVGFSLTYLTVVYNNGETVRGEQVVSTPNFDFPEMSSLTELRYLADVAYQIRSIDFLTKVPNLQTLYVSGSAEYFHDANPFPDRIFSNCNLLIGKPHTNLKELRMYGPIDFPTRLFEVMKEALPNLVVLQVCLSPNVADDFEETDFWAYFHAAVGGISELRGLRKLYLDFNCYRQGIGKKGLNLDQWSEVFSHLFKLQNLTDLLFHPPFEAHSWEWDWSEGDYSDPVFPWLGDVFKSIPNLRRLTIYGSEGRDDDEEEESAEELERNTIENGHISSMYEAGIHLEYRTGGLDVFFEHDTLKCETHREPFLFRGQ